MAEYSGFGAVATSHCSHRLTDLEGTWQRGTSRAFSRADRPLPALSRHSHRPLSHDRALPLHAAHPAPDRLVGDIHATLGEDVLNVAIAQGKAKVEPHCVLDDGRRKLVTGIGDRCHPVILPVPKCQATVRVTMPPLGLLRQDRGRDGGIDR
jgi:hypothetical protein